MSRAIEQRESVNALRLQRFKAGETADEIAQSEVVGVGTVLYSIRRGAERPQMLLHWKLIDLKLQGAIDNELIRARIRIEDADKILDGLARLLSGRRTVIITNPITGAIEVVEIVDPEVLAMGIDLVIKILCLQEKPAPNPINVNLQDN